MYRSAFFGAKFFLVSISKLDYSKASFIHSDYCLQSSVKISHILTLRHFNLLIKSQSFRFSSHLLKEPLFYCVWWFPTRIQDNKNAKCKIKDKKIRNCRRWLDFPVQFEEGDGDGSNKPPLVPLVFLIFLSLFLDSAFFLHIRVGYHVW